MKHMHYLIHLKLTVSILTDRQIGERDFKNVDNFGPRR